jgi:RNA polymerase sigma-70 factor (ECF subfamily)
MEANAMDDRSPPLDEEARLVDEARKGSEEAFTRLLVLHQARVRTYLARFVRRRDVVDDLAQETFLAAWRSLPGFRGDVPLGTWLIGIARHRALDHLRDEGVRKAREGRRLQAALAGWLSGRLRDGTGPEGELDALERCLDRLPPRSARLVRGFYYEGRSGLEMAREQGQGESAVWVGLLRIRQALRRCVEGRLAAPGGAP